MLTPEQLSIEIGPNVVVVLLAAISAVSGIVAACHASRASENSSASLLQTRVNGEKIARLDRYDE